MDKSFVGVLFRNNLELIDTYFYMLRESMQAVQYPIVVVDNGSTDGTTEKLKRLHDAGIVKALFILPENKGIAGGRNILVDYALKNQQHLIIMDSDCFVIRINSLKILEDRLESSKAGIVFGRSQSFNPKWNGFENHDDGMSFAIINWHTFEKIGNFDEQFEMFYDDPDLMIRANQAGIKIESYTDPQVLHLWGMTTGRSELNRKDAVLESDEKKYMEKWNGKY